MGCGSMMKCVVGTIAVMCLAVGLGQSQAWGQDYAGNQYRFAVGTITADTVDYDVSLGGRVEVEVYLRETRGVPTNDFLLVDEQGLSSASIVVDWMVESGVGGPSTIDSTVDIAVNAAFDDPAVERVDLDTDGLELVFGRDVFLQSSGVAPTIAGDTASVYLATLKFTAGDPNVETRVSISDGSPDDETLTWRSPVPLDEALSPGSFTITTPIPEPASGLLLAAVSLAALCRRRPA